LLKVRPWPDCGKWRIIQLRDIFGQRFLHSAFAKTGNRGGDVPEDKKTVTIVVEGTAHEWPKHEQIGYETVVQWAFPDYSATDGKVYTVKYKKGDNEKPEGQLVKGAAVKVKDGMSFSVSRTGQS
jgi:hypothetical protein